MIVSRPQGSRRLFLSGLLAAFAVTPHVALAGQPLHEADRAFITWLGAIGVYDRRMAEGEDGRPDAYWDAVEASEDAFQTMPPDIMTLAGLHLIEVSNAAPGSVIMSKLSDRDTLNSLRTLQCIRPSLSGLMSLITVDLLDNTHRPLGESMLWRLRAKGGVA